MRTDFSDLIKEDIWHFEKANGKDLAFIWNGKKYNKSDIN